MFTLYLGIKPALGTQNKGLRIQRISTAGVFCASIKRIVTSEVIGTFKTSALKKSRFFLCTLKKNTYVAIIQTN